MKYYTGAVLALLASFAAALPSQHGSLVPRDELDGADTRCLDASKTMTGGDISNLTSYINDFCDHQLLNQTDANATSTVYKYYGPSDDLKAWTLVAEGPKVTSDICHKAFAALNKTCASYLRGDERRKPLSPGGSIIGAKSAWHFSLAPHTGLEYNLTIPFTSISGNITMEKKCGSEVQPANFSTAALQQCLSDFKKMDYNNTGLADGSVKPDVNYDPLNKGRQVIYECAGASFIKFAGLPDFIENCDVPVTTNIPDKCLTKTADANLVYANCEQSLAKAIDNQWLSASCWDDMGSPYYNQIGTRLPTSWFMQYVYQKAC